MRDQVIRQTLTESEAARYLGVSRSTLRHGRCYGSAGPRMRTPAYIKVGRKVLYQLADLDSWLNKSRVDSGGGP